MNYAELLLSVLPRTHAWYQAKEQIDRKWKQKILGEQDMITGITASRHISVSCRSLKRVKIMWSNME